MVREIVTLQVGQCGNQLGVELWKKLCSEHGINEKGVARQDERMRDRKDIFFYESDSGEYVPRALLLDLEPGVISSIKSSAYKHLYNPESFWVSPDGGGAGNNWGSGYAQASSWHEELCDLMDREIETSDSMEAFIMCHSIAGGTGSGMGSYMLELFADRYPKKLVLTYSVFPLRAVDVVVQPYNAILTIRRLINKADAVIVLDNTALNNIALQKLKIQKPGFTHTNYVVATAMAATTATIRFPSYVNNNLASTIAPLVPDPRRHFLMTSLSPLEHDAAEALSPNAAGVRKTVPSDIVRRILQQTNFMVSLDPKLGHYLNILAILRGEPTPAQVREALVRAKTKHLMSEYTPGKHSRPSFQITVAKRSVYDLSKTKLSGLMIANHTSIVQVFEVCAKQYDKLMNRQAFVEQYRKEENVQRKFGGI